MSNNGMKKANEKYAALEKENGMLQKVITMSNHGMKKAQEKQ